MKWSNILVYLMAIGNVNKPKHIMKTIALLNAMHTIFPGNITC
jgi:hypothetical protein